MRGKHVNKRSTRKHRSLWNARTSARLPCRLSFEETGGIQFTQLVVSDRVLYALWQFPPTPIRGRVERSSKCGGNPYTRRREIALNKSSALVPPTSSAKRLYPLCGRHIAYPAFAESSPHCPRRGVLGDLDANLFSNNDLRQILKEPCAKKLADAVASGSLRKMKTVSWRSTANE